jgi:PKD repeat protein
MGLIREIEEFLRKFPGELAGLPHRIGPWLRTSPLLEKVIVSAIVIGFFTVVGFVTLESREERFTQLYLYPDSISHYPEGNRTSFTYGVRSYENEPMEYNLSILVGNRTVRNTSFSLDPGKDREEKVTLDVAGIALPVNVSLALSSRFATYRVHYWVKERPPVAAFTANPVNGTEPLNIQFTDLSLHRVTGWRWDFGDGMNSTAMNPNHTYQAGQYTVMLSVNNTEGTDEEIKSNFISVSPKAIPIAAAIQTLRLRQPLPVVDRQNSLDVIGLDYYRGLFANDLVNSSRNIFALENESDWAPPEGSEYLLAQMIVISKGGVSPIFVSKLSFRACIEETGVCSDLVPTVLTLPGFEDGYVKEGESISGWIGFMVPIGSTVKVAYVDSATGKAMGYILMR